MTTNYKHFKRSDTKNFDGNSTNEQKTSSESPTSSTAVVEPSPCESDWNNTYLSEFFLSFKYTSKLYINMKSLK